MEQTIPLRKIIDYASRGISPRYVDVDGLAVVNQKCIRDNKINLELARLTDKSINISDKKRLKKFDILINSTGVGTLGRVAQLKRELNATVDSHVSIFRTAQTFNDEKIDSEYIGYSLQFQEKNIESLGKGATGQTELSKDSVLDNISVFLPDYRTQQAIAKILAAYDDLIENNEKQIRILEKMAQRLYTEWFVKFNFPGHEKVKTVDSGTKYGMIPEGWEVKKLGEIIELAYGKALKADERVLGSIPVYGSSGIIGMHNKSLVSGPGIVVGRKGNMGAVYWIDNDFYPIDTTYYVKASINLYFVYFLLKAQNFISSDVAVPGLSRNQAYTIGVIIPPKKIIEVFTEKMAHYFGMVNNLKNQISNLEQTRDLLIPQLVAGKRKVKN